MKLPKEIRERFAAAGRKGGKAKGRKGFAAMTPEKRKEIQDKAVVARRKKKSGKVA